MNKAEREEAEREAFRLDSEASYATVEIQPTCYPTRITYNMRDRLDLEPYPNPFMMGGWTGNSSNLTLAQLKERLRGWREAIREWEARGLTRITIKRLPAIYRAEPRQRPVREIVQVVGKKKLNKSLPSHQIALF